MTIKVELGTPLLARNEEIAQEIKYLGEDHGIFILNVMSSPGAGKTTLLEASLGRLGKEFNVGVIEGDIATTRDADRISAKGVTAVQLNTHGACHLDARMVFQALSSFDLERLDLLIIENIGNLVCPAEFDLGEDIKTVILSTAEGNDKISKYPAMFREAGILVLNKVDLLPYTDFDLQNFESDARSINPDIEIFRLSALKGNGVDEWAERIIELVYEKKND